VVPTPPKSRRTLVVGSALLALGVAAPALFAQGDAPPAPTPDIVLPMEKQAELTPEAMLAKVADLESAIAVDTKRVEALRIEARKTKDVIKLNCINDKLVQVKQLLRIADTAQTELDAAIASHDEPERYHRFSVVTISAERVAALRGEAEACVGEEIDYLGPLDLDVGQPDVPDDPTVTDPLDDDDRVEPPGYASPVD
jgi:hypothetical protein